MDQRERLVYITYGAHARTDGEQRHAPSTYSVLEGTLWKRGWDYADCAISGDAGNAEGMVVSAGLLLDYTRHAFWQSLVDHSSTVTGATSSSPVATIARAIARRDSFAESLRTKTVMQKKVVLRGVHKSMRGIRANLSNTRKEQEPVRIEARYHEVAVEVLISEVKVKVPRRTGVSKTALGPKKGDPVSWDDALADALSLSHSFSDTVAFAGLPRAAPSAMAPRSDWRSHAVRRWPRRPEDQENESDAPPGTEPENDPPQEDAGDPF